MTQSRGESDTIIAIDLGRHRSFCGLSDTDGPRLVPLCDDQDGLVMRWRTDAGSERPTERLLRLAGDRQDQAVETATAMVSAIFPELTSGATLAAGPRVAVPPSFGPACRSALVDGFTRAGVAVSARYLVDRPVAGLAAWLATTAGQNPPPGGIVLLIDNDGGQLSAAAAELDRRRLLFSVPLSVGPDDDVVEVESRLRVLVEEAQRLQGSNDLVRPGDWTAIASAIEHVVLTGSGAQHPEFLRLVEDVLPESTFLSVGEAQDQHHSVTFGLLNLDAFNGFSACWPTGRITLDGATVRTPGPVRGEDIPLVVSDGSRLAFTGPDGRVLDVEVGSVRSSGVELPRELGPTPTLRVLSDGRILVLGPEGVRPLSIRVRWPVPSTTADVLPLEAVGRRPVHLTDPRVAPRRPATVGS